MKKNSIHWFSAWQLGAGLLAVLGLWASALGLALLGSAQIATAAAAPDTVLPFFLMAATGLTAGALVLPSVVLALSRLAGWKPVIRWPEFRVLDAGLLILVLPVVILLGRWVVSATDLAWLFLPPLHVLAVGLPIWLLVYVSTRGLPLGSSQRMWGVFGSGLVLGPGLILCIEGAILLIIFVLVVLGIASQPKLASEMMTLSNWLSSTSPSQEMILETFSPYLLKPAVFWGFLAFAAVIVPLIEELFKPIGVWLLVGQGLSPAAGFAAGVLSGAGYALFENMAMTMGGTGWASLVVARSGTAVMHIFTSGLTGWALVSAWRKGGYVRLAFAYLGSVLIHGTWNALSISSVFVTLARQSPNAPIDLAQYPWLETVMVFGLVFLAVGALCALVLFGRWLAQAQELRMQELQTQLLRTQELLPETQVLEGSESSEASDIPVKEIVDSDDGITSIPD